MSKITIIMKINASNYIFYNVGVFWYVFVIPGIQSQSDARIFETFLSYFQQQDLLGRNNDCSTHQEWYFQSNANACFKHFDE